jgi:hypothetical protein
MAEIESAIHRTTSNNRAADFARLLSSRIKPHLEIRLEALEHLFFNVFDVGNPGPND